jgi:hypothetical protein
LNAKSTSPKLLAVTVREFSVKSSHNAAIISATTAILASFSAVLPSITSNSVNSTAAANRTIFPPPPNNSSRPELSSRTQNPKALPSFGKIMPIIGGSAMEFETKRQRNNYFRSVNTIINDGPAARPELAKVPITFTEEDFKLKSTNHNDAMII